MRALVQRVAEARVRVGGEVVGEVGRGFLVLLGVGQADTDEHAAALAAKVAGLRIFEDAGGKMNLGLDDVGGTVLCVSQFTLYGDVRKGRRPSFTGAAEPETGRRLYERFCEEVEGLGPRCERGVFGAHMEVELVNDGPVTLWIDTDELERPRRA
jgi:D-tyrosyl-tRNA(Tyr) deacylase